MIKPSLKTFMLWGCMMVSSVPAFAQDMPKLQVSVEGVNTQGFIEPKYAFCTMAEKGHTMPGENFNVGLHWTAGPEGTKSYAVVMVDEDVPADFSNANKEGKTLPESQPRRSFYHWILTDIPTSITAIPAGAESNSTRPKKPGKTAYGVAGINDYAATQGGYDGPCPPWNDERLHHYYLRVYALDVETIDNIDHMDGKKVMEAIQPHILASGETVGKFTTNPEMSEK